jgi:hypothetical protein
VLLTQHSKTRRDYALSQSDMAHVTSSLRHGKREGCRVSFACAEQLPGNLGQKSRTLIQFFDDVPDSVRGTVNPWLMCEIGESLPAGCQIKP